MMSESPMSETTSSVKCMALITMKVASSDAGIAIMTTMAFRQACRNSMITIAVSTMPSNRFWNTPSSDACV